MIFMNKNVHIQEIIEKQWFYLSDVCWMANPLLCLGAAVHRGGVGCGCCYKGVMVGVWGSTGCAWFSNTQELVWVRVFRRILGEQWVRS